MNETNNPKLIIGKLNLEDIKRQYKTSIEDFLIISEEKILIQHIRDLIHFLNLRPMNSQFKLIIIENIDKMTTEAANALLKTLEEPPAYGKIIMTTQNLEKILPTIKSRCEISRNNISTNNTPSELYMDPMELAKLNFAERFSWVASVFETNQVIDIIVMWQEYFRKKLISGEDKIYILKKLSYARDLLRFNISVKLLLENLVIEF